MTLIERDDLETALERVKDMMDRARYMMQEITDGYFDKFNPNDREDAIAMRYDFQCKRAFALAAESLMCNIMAELPQPEYVARLEVSDAGKEMA